VTVAQCRTKPLIFQTNIYSMNNNGLADEKLNMGINIVRSICAQRPNVPFDSLTMRSGARMGFFCYTPTCSRVSDVVQTSVVRVIHHSCGRPQTLNTFKFRTFEPIDPELCMIHHITEFTECGKIFVVSSKVTAPHIREIKCLCFFIFFLVSPANVRRVTQDDSSDVASPMDVPFLCKEILRGSKVPKNPNFCWRLGGLPV
jgi:hypothetical protein